MRLSQFAGLGSLARTLLLPALLVGAVASATDRYVAQNGQTPDTGAPPSYTSWSTAASNLQEVVDVAVDGDTIFVGPGRYTAPPDAPNQDGTNVVYVSRPLSLRASFPPGIESGAPILDGEGRHRCMRIYIPSDSLLLDGLTLTNGYAGGTNTAAAGQGGGIRLTTAILPLGATFANCVITHCTAIGRGGGIDYYNVSNADLQWTLSNCVIRSNTSGDNGGGIYRRSANREDAGILLRDCLLEDNEAALSGGALYSQGGHLTIRNSRMLGNQANGTGSSAGGAGLFYHSSLGASIINSLLADNHTTGYGSATLIITWTDADRLQMGWENCTLAGHTGTRAISSRRNLTNEASSFHMVNSIVYDSGAIYHANLSFTNVLFSHVCHDNELLDGPENITEDPLFVDTASGNYRLKPGSPCLQAGINLPWMAGATDLDRRPRIDAVFRKVDIGAYEHHPTGGFLIIR